MGEGPELVDVHALRAAVSEHYAEVAEDPRGGDFHFHTGRAATARLGYDDASFEGFPEPCIEAFAGVANPFHWGLPTPGEKVIDVGSGGGLDAMIAARAVGSDGAVIGVDMTPAMLERARENAAVAGLDNIEFRHGFAEEMPVPDGWADVVISNGVLNLVPDKVAAYQEIFRVLRPGGRIQIADVCVEREVPDDAKRDIDLWKGWIAGALPCAGWTTVIDGVGFVDLTFGDPVDTYAGASGEANARTFGVFGHPFTARKPG